MTLLVDIFILYLMTAKYEARTWCHYIMLLAATQYRPYLSSMEQFPFQKNLDGQKFSTEDNVSSGG